MSLWRLVWRNLLSHPVRSLLTVGAIAVAMFLFCFVRSIVTSLDAAVNAAKTNRIIVASAVSLFQSLPTPYLEKIKSIDGVEEACNFTWFARPLQEAGRTSSRSSARTPRSCWTSTPELGPA